MIHLLFLLLFLGTAVADERHGVRTHEMYNDCKIALRMLDGDYSVSTSDAISDGYCMGHLRGLADEIADAAPDSVTIKSGVSTEALVRSFVNYVNAHPAEMDAQASSA